MAMSGKARTWLGRVRRCKVLCGGVSRRLAGHGKAGQGYGINYGRFQVDLVGPGVVMYC